MTRLRRLWRTIDMVLRPSRYEPTQEQTNDWLCRYAAQSGIDHPDCIDGHWRPPGASP